ncbi:MAG: hypothetical protein WCR42_07075 [bacterium]
MSKNIPFLVVSIVILGSLFLKAEPNDSNYVFKSPRSLIGSQSTTSDLKYSAGGIVVITESGFGGGIYYDIRIHPKLALEFDMPITYLRASDEIQVEVRDQAGTGFEWKVPGKINRLYRIPITAGLRYQLFSNSLAGNFKPYLTAGAGMGLILQTPYQYEFFHSFNYLKSYAKPAIFAGIGADFSGNSNRISRVFVKYYYIPFGGDGIESVIGLPIKNCGGLFLGIDIGGGWK